MATLSDVDLELGKAFTLTPRPKCYVVDGILSDEDAERIKMPR